MRIRVAFFTPSLRHAAVHVVPSWWQRLFGAREYDAIACGDPGGWSWEQGPRIDDLRILSAIERERAQCVAAQRTADLRRGVYP